MPRGRAARSLWVDSDREGRVEATVGGLPPRRDRRFHLPCRFPRSRVELSFRSNCVVVATDSKRMFSRTVDTCSRPSKEGPWPSRAAQSARTRVSLPAGTAPTSPVPGEEVVLGRSLGTVAQSDTRVRLDPRIGRR